MWQFISNRKSLLTILISYLSGYWQFWKICWLTAAKSPWKRKNKFNIYNSNLFFYHSLPMNFFRIPRRKIFYISLVTRLKKIITNSATNGPNFRLNCFLMPITGLNINDLSYWETAYFHLPWAPRAPTAALSSWQIWQRGCSELLICSYSICDFFFYITHENGCFFLKGVSA